MELKEYIAPLLKWWWLLLASTLVATVSSLLAVSQQPSIYVAETTLMIGRALENPNPTGNDLYLGQQLATTYADIAKREPVRQATMDVLELTWLPEYNVRPVSNTQLMLVSVEDTDPVRAMAVANELAHQLILRSPTNSQESLERQAFINEQLDELQVKIQETQDDIADKQEELANMISARQIQDTQNQIAALETKLNTLQSNYANLISNTQQGALNTLTVIEPASAPSEPVGPDVPMTVLTSSAIGFTLAAGAAYLLEYLDNTVKNPDEVKKLTDLPTLAGIAHIKGERYRDKLITLKHPRSPISEAYRSLRTNIQFSTIDHSSGISLLVSSPNPTEGKSVTVANLAVVMAQAGHKVLVIDSDLRRPVQHRLFQLPNRNGLTDILLEMSEDQINNNFSAVLQWGLQKTEVEKLYVLTCGALPPNPSELLGSHKMKLVLSALSEHFDYVLLDSPPELIVTDAAVLSTLTSGVILIANTDTTTKNGLKQAVEQLRGVNSNINLLGVVLNDLSPQRDGYYYNYYYYKKSYYRDESYGYGMESRDGDGSARDSEDGLFRELVRGTNGTMKAAGKYLKEKAPFLFRN